VPKSSGAQHPDERLVDVGRELVEHEMPEKVSVNPTGRFGARETEPGWSAGVGRVEDELMRISLQGDDARALTRT